MVPHLAKRFAFPITVAHLTQVRDFLNGFLEMSGQEFRRLARADQRTGENMGDPERGEDFGSHPCLLLPSGIDGHRALAGDPAADVLIRLSVSYQYHQRHAASFPWSKRLGSSSWLRIDI